MTKEDNLVIQSNFSCFMFSHTIKHFMKRTVSTWKNCKRSWKAGRFYRIKNKEQGREKQEIPDGLGPHSQPLFRIKRNKKITIEPKVGLVFGDWQTIYTEFLVK